MVYTRLKYTIYDVYEIWVYEIGFTVIGPYTELKVYKMSRHQGTEAVEQVIFSL